jgi:hypothetical protein
LHVKNPRKYHTYFLAKKSKWNVDFSCQLKTKHTMKQENKQGRKKEMVLKTSLLSTLYISFSHKNTFVIYCFALKTLMFCNFVFF